MQKHSKTALRFAIAITLTIAFVGTSVAERLRPETTEAFDSYVQQREKQIAQELNAGPFLHLDRLPTDERENAYAHLKKGDVLTQRMPPGSDEAMHVPHGLIHHWIGTVFIPGVTLSQTVAFLLDYDNQYKFYGPEVQRSKLLERNGNDYKMFLRLKKTKIITVILDTTYDVKYVPISADRAVSYSHSTRIAEVENAGKPNESEKPVGDDGGFMWRLNSYWAFLQRDGGVYLQLEAISLTRDIPSAVGWLVAPFVTSIPRESLVFTLARTREALMKPKQ
ncbi:MAG TPA: hypothetical protein VEH30_14985 [Terriglobales bacterium]|nr:hypothetical protein [Terriglobales bacterium]